MEIETGEPVVKLLAYTPKAFASAVASARTCYSPNVIFVEDVSEKQKETIGKSIYEAGHHTTFQHPVFAFGLENISRQWIWTFAHSHPFYNSSQSSQRYVVLDKARVFIPPIEGEALEIYKNAITQSWDAYSKISKIIEDDNFRMMERIGKIKGQTEKQIRTDSEKKAIENARYVVPIGAFSSMWHSISGLELMRYWRMANACDCPHESRKIIAAMIEEARKADPEYFEKINIEPIASEKLLENKKTGHDDNFIKEFDNSLGEHISKMIEHTQNGEAIVADAVREVLGYSKSRMSDAEAIEMVMSPDKNEYLLETMNLYTHSPMMRALNHVNYTFKKKISHTADSQDQRHRTTPASRPLLTRTHTKEPDYIEPSIIKNNAEAHKIYTDTMNMLWDAKNQLIERGVPDEFAVYLLPNAVALRYTQTGSLINYLHKWRLRTCFTAQLEIFEQSMDELSQVREVHPNLAKHIGPPCTYRKGRVEHKVPEGPCAEGPRWCGITVWNNFPKVTRPF